MTKSGDIDPTIPVEYVLTPDEAEEFQNRVIWGAVNYLWQGDFLSESRDGEDVHFCKKVIDPSGPVRVQVTARAWNDFDDSVSIDEPTLVHSVNVRLERMCAELTDSMIAALKRVDVAIGVASEVDEAEKTESEDQGIIQAWEVKDFYLDDSPEGSLEIEHYHELQDPDGDVLDDDTAMSWGVTDGEPLSGSEADLLEELDEKLSGSLTLSDRYRIMAMFAIAGLPTGVLDQDL